MRNRNYLLLMVFVLIFIVFIGSEITISKGTSELQKHIYSWFQIDNPYYLENYDIKLKSADIMKDFYKNIGFKPVWVTDKHIKEIGHQFIYMLAESANEGLLPEEYNISVIKTLADRIVSQDISYQDIKWRDLVIIDLLLTDAFFIYTSDRISGRLDEEDKKRVWVKRSKIIDLNVLLTNVLKDDNITYIEQTIGKIPRIFEYNYLKEILIQYRNIKVSGGWPYLDTTKVLQEGDYGSEVGILYERLQKEPGLEVKLTGQSQQEFDGKLKKAVIAFQKRYGLPLTGKVDEQTRYYLNIPVQNIIEKITINIERLRWLVQNPEEEFLIVNIPEFKLSFYKNRQRKWEKKVIVGRTSRETPVFSTEIIGLLFNPRWYIPHSIAVKDILPRQKEDESYLEEKNIRIYEERNSRFYEVNPESIDWQKTDIKKFDYYLWQDSGPWNALGQVIFRSPNQYQVYLHDTPEKYLFDNNIRTYSSGCVRVYNALEMAEFFIENYSRISLKEMKEIINSGKETFVFLKEKITLHFLYITTWFNQDKEFIILKDVYHKDRELRTEN